MIIESGGAPELKITWATVTSPSQIALWLREPMLAAGCTDADVHAMYVALWFPLQAIQAARGPVDKDLVMALLAIEADRKRKCATSS
jgi:hypothetical protein